jgi:hypothetical protein
LGFADDRFEGGKGGVFLELPHTPVAAIQDMKRVSADQGSDPARHAGNPPRLEPAVDK